MCDSLGIEPKPNNGTLRLPLQPIGLHSDEPTSSEHDHPDLSAGISHTANDPTEASEPKLADTPVETNVEVVGGPPSDTKSVGPIETVIVIETASPEGISRGTRFIWYAKLTALRRQTIRRNERKAEQFLGSSQSENEGCARVGERGHCESQSKPQRCC